MKFGLVNGDKTEAIKGVRGTCPFCGAELIAKCGDFKMNHWAHKGKLMCDVWWENETEWHRVWKNNFPVEWQEVIHFDEKTGEKHIADVQTVHNLVIEFQHSHIKPEERTSREKFYKNLLWVVDGTRLKRDYPRFLKGRKNGFENTIFHNTDNPKIYRVEFLDWWLPTDWLESSVPVIFDFLGDGSMEDPEGLRKILYCLFPQFGDHARVAEISREAFIKATISGDWSDRVQKFIDDFREQVKNERKEPQQSMSHTSKGVTYTWNGIPLIGGKKEFQKRIYKQNRKRR